MTNKEKKKLVRSKFLKPKDMLKKERLGVEKTTSYMAGLVGLDRRQYEQKEKGRYPFNDYEMKIIADDLGFNVDALFFND